MGDMRATVGERLLETHSYHPCWNLYEEYLPSRQYPLIVTDSSCQRVRLGVINRKCGWMYGMQAGKSTILYLADIRTGIRHVF